MKTIFRSGKRESRRFVWLGVACVAGQSTLALAQSGPQSLPGTYTELQRPVADKLFEACLNINGLPGGAGDPNPNGTATQRLSNSCTTMVSTAFNANSTDPSNRFDLDLNADQLATGIQAIAPVQANAQKQIGIEATKMNTIGARLLDLRGGVRGLVLGYNGLDLRASENWRTARQKLSGATGGGAAADDVLGGRLGGFVNVAGSWGDVDRTPLQDAYDYDSVNMLAGVDYRVGNSAVVGMALSYSRTDADYERSLGNVKATTTSLTAYGTHYRDNWYVDAMLAYGRVDYDTSRRIAIPSNNNNPGIFATATASPEGSQWSASIGVGTNITSGRLVVTPSARLGYIKVKNKAFTESEPVAGLALAVSERNVKSLQSSIGAKVGTSVSTGSGVFGPYVSLNWLHEFENDNPSILSKYVADPTNTFFAIPTARPTRDYAVLALGSTATFPNDLSAFVQFSTALGLKDQSNHAIIVGLRKQF